MAFSKWKKASDAAFYFFLSCFFLHFTLLAFSPSLHPTGASLEEIRSKYKKQALRWHPDKHGNSRQATMVYI